ncbi:MAG: adenylyl-sulfate kinase [Alphaproteobacteria bacterium]|nr:adenylyl-sulfate kinase [Alphaproteobacteria bacterium]
MIGQAREGGMVYWITGLSGAGKSTLAALLRDRLAGAGRSVILLDGDALREILGKTSNFQREERLELAMIYARLCREISRQGIDVVCATISMFHQVQDWNRQNIEGYKEIFLRVPYEVLASRDTKGIYPEPGMNETLHVMGRHIEPEFPIAPDLILDNVPPLTPEMAVERIWRETAIS